MTRLPWGAAFAVAIVLHATVAFGFLFRTAAPPLDAGGFGDGGVVLGLASDAAVAEASSAPAPAADPVAAEVAVTAPADTESAEVTQAATAPARAAPAPVAPSAAAPAVPPREPLAADVQTPVSPPVVATVVAPDPVPPAAAAPATPAPQREEVPALAPRKQPPPATATEPVVTNRTETPSPAAVAATATATNADANADDTGRPTAATSRQSGSQAAAVSTGGARSAHGTGKPGRGDPSAARDYFRELMAWLARHKAYPVQEKKAKHQGVVTLEFAIERSGRVLSARVKNGSGYLALDQAALDMVARASPVPAIPDALARERLSLAIPIEFSLITK